MYWNAHDMVDARKMVIIVLDVAWNECSLRRRTFTPKQSDWRVVPRIGRVTDKRTAVCMHTTFCEVMLSNRVYLKLGHCIIYLWSVRM